MAKKPRTGMTASGEEADEIVGAEELRRAELRCRCGRAASEDDGDDPDDRDERRRSRSGVPSERACRP